MDHETAGDPVRGLKWTRRTTAKVGAELCKLGTDICARTVARLLQKMGFSLRVNHKKRAGASHPNRDEQFQHITELRERCAADNVPVISVDTKKKELVGAFRNPGAKWDHSPELVNDHDFPSAAEGRAIPYGVRLFCVGGPEGSRRGCERHGKSYLTRRRRGEEGDGGGSLTGGAIPSA